jgi:hypothetical protein
VSAHDAFAPIYDEWTAHMTEDVPFYVSLASEADGPVVKRADGNGRPAVPVARETGSPVIGVNSSLVRRPFDDRSPEFVWIARRPR